jgi:cob(I)alamin adenosyltransferase
MVYLSRIYTRSGDDGSTGLGDGSRVRKDSLRIEAIGAVDETNAAIGLLLADDLDRPERQMLIGVANDLFDLGADLCTPIADGDGAIRIVETQTAALENSIDRINERLSPVESFVLRGGAPAAARAHFACTVCRRAERRVVALAAAETVNSHALVYLNRLSDLLFVLARRLNDDGKADILWIPGKNREP